MKLKTKMRLLGIAIGTIGWGLIVWKLGVIVGIALLLVLWGNNLDQRADKYE